MSEPQRPETPVDATTRQTRWAEEARFFDERAERTQGDVPKVTAQTLRRFQELRRQRTLPPEFSIGLGGDFRDKHVLDLGCGDGTWSVLLALLGARVTGVDISPKAIELAKQRAQVNGVQDRCVFVCGPVEANELGVDTFDIVWGQAFLHHVLEDLDLVLREAVRATKPGGRLIFVEPLNLNQPLRRLRLLLPVSMEATPGERPLEHADIAQVRTHVPGLSMRQFRLVGRLDRMLRDGGSYEGSTGLNRFAIDTMAEIDRALLTLPFFDTMGSIAVLWGDRPTADAVN